MFSPSLAIGDTSAVATKSSNCLGVCRARRYKKHRHRAHDFGGQVNISRCRALKTLVPELIQLLVDL